MPVAVSPAVSPPSRPTADHCCTSCWTYRRSEGNNGHRPNLAMRSKQSIVLCSLVAIITVSVSNSFQVLRNKQQSCLISGIRTAGTCSSGNTRLYVETRGNNGKTKFGQRTNVEDRFLSDFKTADGSSVDPYKMLQVKRSATNAEIKQSYRRLSRKLHPDMVAQSDVLPGRW